MKTYQDRVTELATKLAKEWKPDTFDRLSENEREYVIGDMTPLAVIALADTAEVAEMCYDEGYNTGYNFHPNDPNKYINSLGLTPTENK